MNGSETKRGPTEGVSSLSTILLCVNMGYQLPDLAWRVRAGCVHPDKDTDLPLGEMAISQQDREEFSSDQRCK